jgi:hypothetical protein
MQSKVSIFLIAVLFCFTSTGQDSLCVDPESGKIEFKRNSATLTAAARLKLDSLIVYINNQITSEVLITSQLKDFCDKCGVLSWNRTNAVIHYLIKKGIPEERLRPYSWIGGAVDYITLKLTALPLTSPSSPHPNAGLKNF